MKPFTSFLKTQLNINYGISALKYRFAREKKKRWEPVLIAVSIIVSLVPLMAIYTAMMAGVFAAGMVMNQPEIVLTVAFLFAQLVILFFGIFYIMGTFYFSQDLESIVPLPLRPYEVMCGKFAVIMVNEYLTSMPILLPPLIIYGAGTGQGLMYWVKSLVLILVAPALPLTIAAILVMVMMRFINFRRYKDLFAVIGGLLAIVIGFGFSMVMQNIPQNGNSEEYIQSILQSQSGLIELIGQRFPPSIWATKGLSEQGLAGMGYFLLFLALCMVLFALLLWLSNRLFYKSLLAGQEVGKRKKKLTSIQLEKQYEKEADPVKALMGREWKLLIRTPLYALNGLTGAFVGPLMLLIMLIAQNGSGGTETLLNMISTPETAPYVLLGGLGVMLFTAGMNVVASTAVSREGNTFWITKMIPVPAKKQVAAKFLVSYLISAVGIIVTGVILWLIIRQPLLSVLGAIIVGILGSVPMVALSLLLDVFHPKLVWNSEQEAMKQNMNGLVGMLLSMLVMLVQGVAAAVLLILHMPMVLVFAAIGFVSVLLGILSIWALNAVAERKYQELEA